MTKISLIILAILTTLAGVFYFSNREGVNRLTLGFAPQYGVSSGLISYWTADTRQVKWTSSSGGQTLDISGNGYHGTFVNMSQSNVPSLGKTGQGLKLDGTNDYIQNSNSVYDFTSGSFTLSGWFKFNTLTTNVGGQGPIIFYKGPYQQYGYYVQVGTGGTIAFYTNQSGAIQSTTVTGAAISVNAWHHIAITRSGSSAKIYINGVERTVNYGTHINPSSSPKAFRVGNYVDSGDNNPIYMNGIVDDVRIYSRSLSATEVNQIYRQGLSEGSR